MFNLVIDMWLCWFSKAEELPPIYAADRSKQELSEEHCQYLSYQMLRLGSDTLDRVA